jgi:CRISPR-associated protein Csx14
VATLGGQPQIVTFTLDLLLQARYPISEVIVLHPRAASQPRLQRALLCLNAEFSGNYYQATQHPIHFHSHVLELDGQPIDDISDADHADGTLNTIHRLIGDLKRQGYRIHFSASGGRRLMSLLAISVATLNFDHHDHIWHIYTPQDIVEQARDGALMHVPPDAGVRLIEGQYIFLGAHYHPSSSFRSARNAQRSQMDAEEHTRCSRVINETTPAQLRILRAFSQGLRPQQVANELNISLATVHSHTTALLSLCRNAWNIDKHEHLDYHFLHTAFSDYFTSDE